MSAATPAITVAGQRLTGIRGMMMRVMSQKYGMPTSFASGKELSDWVQDWKKRGAVASGAPKPTYRELPPVQKKTTLGA